MISPMNSAAAPRWWRDPGGSRWSQSCGLGVVGVGLDAPAHGEAVSFSRRGIRHGLGRLAERDREDAGGERIERAGVTGLLAPNARRTAPTAWVDVMPTGLSRTSQPCTGLPFLRRVIGLAFVEGWRRVSSEAGAGSGLLEVLSDLGRAEDLFHPLAPRRTNSSARKRTSGANLRLTTWAISPRIYLRCRPSASSTGFRSLPPNGTM